MTLLLNQFHRILIPVSLARGQARLVQKVNLGETELSGQFWNAIWLLGTDDATIVAVDEEEFGVGGCFGLNILSQVKFGKI